MWISTLVLSWSAGSFSDSHGSTDVPIRTYAARTIIVTTARRAVPVTARACPRRTGGGLRLTELKSDKSRRTIAIPPPLVAALRSHRAAQLEEQMTPPGPIWEDRDFVWFQPNGRPIGNHADWAEWKALLKAAGIRDARVHDARHTAATLLLAQGDRPAGRDGDPRPLSDQHDVQVRPCSATSHD